VPPPVMVPVRAAFSALNSAGSLKQRLR